MRRLNTLAAIALLLTVAMLPIKVAATSCDPTLSQEFLKYADWVFLATVVEAGLSDSSSHRIDFVVTDLDRLRGSPPDRIDLIASIGAYEPKITIGEKYLIYVNSAERTVGFCRGFRVYSPDDFLPVLLMRKKGDCGTLYDRQIAVKFSRKEVIEDHGPLAKSDIEKMLRHFKELNPILEIASADRKINVKGIDFVFIDNELVAIEVGECAA